MYLKILKKCSEGVNWIQLAHDGIQLLDPVNTVINFLCL